MPATSPTRQQFFNFSEMWRKCHQDSGGQIDQVTVGSIFQAKFITYIYLYLIIYNIVNKIQKMVNVPVYPPLQG